MQEWCEVRSNTGLQVPLACRLFRGRERGQQTRTWLPPATVCDAANRRARHRGKRGSGHLFESRPRPVRTQSRVPKRTGVERTCTPCVAFAEMEWMEWCKGWQQCCGAFHSASATHENATTTNQELAHYSHDRGHRRQPTTNGTHSRELMFKDRVFQRNVCKASIKQQPQTLPAEAEWMER